MKKNSMGSYNENSSSDSYDEDIDIETGEQINPKKKGVLPAYQEMVEWAKKRRGAGFLSITKQFGAFKKAKAFGLSPSDLKKRWQDMEADEWWVKRGFDWGDVVNSFDKKPK